MFIGFVIGVVSACFAFFILLSMGINKTIFMRVRERLKFNSLLQNVVPPMVVVVVVIVIFFLNFIPLFLLF